MDFPHAISLWKFSFAVREEGIARISNRLPLQDLGRCASTSRDKPTRTTMIP
jgi:hypothetical protein